MQVYLDVVFLLNGIVNYLILSAAARLMGDAGHRGRRILAALLGSVYACAAFLPGFTFLSGIVWRVVVLCMMLLLSFGVRAKTIPAGAIVLALSLALGGLVLVLSGVLGAQVWILEGRAFYAMGAGTLVLTAGALYLGAWLLLQGTMTHTGGQIVAARLKLAGRSTWVSVLRDSGNTLRDPFSGNAVPVLERGVLTELMPEASQLALDNPTLAMTQLHALHLSGRLIPYRAVGTRRALLLAIKFDAITIGRRTRKGVFAAISPTALSEQGNYAGLIGEGECG